MAGGKKKYNKSIIPNNIAEIPNNIAEIIDVINYKNSNIPPIKLKNINNSKYILVGNYNYNKNEEIINLESAIFSGNLELSKDSIYIGIDIKDSNNLGFFNVYYYGKYIKTIENKNKKFIKFENGEVDNTIVKLYKLIIDIYKKYGIKNNNWKNEEIKNTNDFLFRNIKYIEIPEKFIHYVRYEIKKNSNNNNNIDSTNIINYIKKIGSKKLLNIKNNPFIKFFDNKNIKNTSSPLIIKIINNTNNINKTDKLYFAYIKYNFSDSEIFDKCIYLGKFIKKEGNFLYFENIKINPKSEKLEKFDLYYAIE